MSPGYAPINGNSIICWVIWEFIRALFWQTLISHHGIRGSLFDKCGIPGNFGIPTVQKGGEGMLVQLNLLECIRTRTGEQKEEAFVVWRIDEDDDLVGCWCPDQPIRSGETVRIGLQVVATRKIEIRVGEDDPGGKYDDCTGQLEIELSHPTGSSEDTPSFRSVIERAARASSVGANSLFIRTHHRVLTTADNRGMTRTFMVDLPYHADGSGYGRYDKHYRLYFDVYVHPDDRHLLPIPPYCLQLRELECRNAQEWKDHAFIKVNGITVWGPYWMRDSGNRSRRTININPIRIRADTEISLWEEDNDGTRSDHFGSFWLHLTEDYDFDHDPDPIRFHADDTIVGDATYYLSYRVCQRIENPEDPRELWRHRC